LFYEYQATNGQNILFEIDKGQTSALTGESGSEKSLVAHSFM